ncbi:MAG TPA: type IV toxin-antitoxin system AbiEi family antitoxin domain-containing protein [Pedococcus sp.]|uniref:type IV toxin-antitoxin system AbiEi family antitoxin domain-containing protein n=1 Tax=Pedococcus sp. TaxID=2860345 RepID=UPI002F9514BA
MSSIEPALLDLAHAQHGAFGAQQARALGVTDLDIHGLVRQGEVVRVRRGAFVLAESLQGLKPESDYALRTRAVLLSRPGATWASHHAALALADLPLVACDLTRFDVCARVKASHRRGGVVTHPLPPDEKPLVLKGARSITTETALAQVAASSGVKAGVAALDAALHSTWVTAEGVEEAAARLELGPRAQGRVTQALGLADAHAESPGESLTRLVLTGLGFSVRSQVRISDTAGFVGRVDFLVGERVVVEFDGLMKYEGAQGRGALAAEKRREDRLRAAGYEVVRLTWADLDRPNHLARLVREATARAARGR